MKREEFLSKQADSERRISRRVIPLGVIYFIRLVSPVGILILALLLRIYFASDARNSILYELLFCVLLFVGSFLAEKYSRKQLSKLGLRCPACQGYLIFVEGKKTAETGRCHHCGAQIFEL